MNVQTWSAVQDEEAELDGLGGYAIWVQMLLVRKRMCRLCMIFIKARLMRLMQRMVRISIFLIHLNLVKIGESIRIFPTQMKHGTMLCFSIVFYDNVRATLWSCG